MLDTRRIAALVALCAAVLMGCSDEPEPRFSEPSESAPPSGASTSPSATGSDAQPADSPQSQLISDYVEAISLGLKTGNPADMQELTSSRCEVCQSVASTLTAAYSDGGRIEGAEWTVVMRERRGKTADGGELWFVDVETTEETWLDPNGNIARVVPAGTQLLAINVSRGSDPIITNVRFRES